MNAKLRYLILALFLIAGRSALALNSEPTLHLEVDPNIIPNDTAVPRTVEVTLRWEANGLGRTFLKEWTLDWGDGSSVIERAPLAGTVRTFTHTYSEPGLKILTLTAIDHADPDRRWTREARTAVGPVEHWWTDFKVSSDANGLVPLRVQARIRGLPPVPGLRLEVQDQYNQTRMFFEEGRLLDGFVMTKEEVLDFRLFPNLVSHDGRIFGIVPETESVWAQHRASVCPSFSFYIGHYGTPYPCLSAMNTIDNDFNGRFTGPPSIGGRDINGNRNLVFPYLDIESGAQESHLIRGTITIDERVGCDSQYQSTPFVLTTAKETVILPSTLRGRIIAAEMPFGGGDIIIQMQENFFNVYSHRLFNTCQPPFCMGGLGVVGESQISFQSQEPFLNNAGFFGRNADFDGTSVWLPNITSNITLETSLFQYQRRRENDPNYFIVDGAPGYPDLLPRFQHGPVRIWTYGGQIFAASDLPPGCSAYELYPVEAIYDRYLVSYQFPTFGLHQVKATEIAIGTVWHNYLDPIGYALVMGPQPDLPEINSLHLLRFSWEPNPVAGQIQARRIGDHVVDRRQAPDALADLNRDGMIDAADVLLGARQTTE